MQSQGPVKTGYEMQGNQYSSPGGQAAGYSSWTHSSQVVPVGSGVVQHQRDWLIPAILATIFCFWPTGIGAIIYAVKANKAIQYGEGDLASSYGRNAKTLVIVSIVTGIVIVTLSVIVRVLLTIVYS